MRYFLLRVFLVGLSAGLLFAGAANAANIELMQVANIKGSSTIKGYQNWIDVNSFSWGVSVATPNLGSGAGVGKAVLSDFSWSQLVDQSAPGLFQDAVKGAKIPTITFDVLKTGGNTQPTKYFEMSFTNAMITSLNYSGSSGGNGVDLNGTFAYQSVKMTYWPTDSKGGIGSPVSASYDLKTQTGNIGALMSVYSLGVAGPVSPVPEPEAYGMMMVGLGLIGFVVSCRKRNSLSKTVVAPKDSTKARSPA